MKLTSLKSFAVIIGDVVAFYATLFFILYVRYGLDFWTQLSQHILSFTLILFVWMGTYYIAGLYDLRRLRNTLDFFQVLTGVLILNAILAIAFFYIFPVGIAPKTNLFIFIFIFGLIQAFWRRAFNRFAASLRPMSNVLLMGEGESVNELHRFLDQNPQLGYKIVLRALDNTEDLPDTLTEWRQLVSEHGLNLIVVPRHFRKNASLSRVFFELLENRVRLRDFPEFYESVLRKVPLREIDEEWFLENVTNQSLIYNDTKRAVELAAAIIFQMLALLPEILIALAIKLSSPGPVIYKQVRLGKYARPFMLYKFRTMRADAEKNGVQWAAANDARVTGVGRFLRATHLDELPQLINIIFGDLSFVGPRPERPEFVAKLKEIVPFYEIRLFVKPGVTGWAQIHHPADQTVDDVERKLEYDIYYLKNRSALIDLAILAKTARTIFTIPR